MKLKKRRRKPTLTRRNFIQAKVAIAGTGLLSFNSPNSLQTKNQEAVQSWDFLTNSTPQNDSALNIISGAVKISNITFHPTALP
jgi:hypothetical protein